MLTLNTREFLWEPNQKIFMTEASMAFRQGVPREFYMQSESTDRMVQMECVRINRDSEGDVKDWEFKPKENLDFSAIVFND